MDTTIAIPVTSQGVLVPRSLMVGWGSVEEVEAERHSGVVIIRPKVACADPARAQIISKMKAAGLIEELPWSRPPYVSPEERARLAKKLSDGKPLSEMIIEERRDPA
ncbi:MAG: hypothetical protein JW850_03565 [Thermoflexales bacterium]|nr:hypothetical protein [Thermoflexales bacterium]